MEHYYKTEGNIIYQGGTMLTWGPFYYHSFDNANAKMDGIMEWITDWVNEKDPSLKFQPQDVKQTKDGRQISFNIQAWKNATTHEECKGIITVEDIFFED